MYAFCEELLECDAGLTYEQCVPFWSDGIATILESTIVGEGYGTDYDYKIIGSLKEQMQQGLIDFGIGAGAAIGTIKATGVRAGGPRGPGQGSRQPSGGRGKADLLATPNATGRQQFLNSFTADTPVAFTMGAAAARRFAAGESVAAVAAHAGTGGAHVVGDTIEIFVVWGQFDYSQA